MSARRHFPQGHHSPVFAYVGEIKGLKAGGIGLTKKPVYPPHPGIPYVQE